MFTGVKNLRAAFFIGALSLSLYTPVSHGEAGNVLFGAAAITGAVGTMVAPAIMAGANVDVARINAGVSTYMAGLSAATQAYAIGASTTQAVFNTLATLRIASMNTQKELAQTYLTTAYQAWDRDQYYRLERERLASDNYFRNRRFNLEILVAQAQQELAQVQFNASLMAQGLSNGFKAAGSSLGVQNVNNTQPVLASAGTMASNLNPNQWDAQGTLKPQASALAKAFRGVASLAGGSSVNRKVKSDIGLFMQGKTNSRAMTNSQFALHQSRDLSSQDASTHDGSFRALRGRPVGQ